MTLEISPVAARQWETARTHLVALPDVISGQVAATRDRWSQHPDIPRDHLVAGAVIVVGAFAVGALVGAAIARSKAAKNACDCESGNCCEA